MINKEPIEIEGIDLEIPSGYDTLSVEQRVNGIKNQLSPKEYSEMTRWGIYCCGDYDGGSELHIQTYRMEYPIETSNRIKREEQLEAERLKAEEKQKKEQEKRKAEQEKRLKDPEYIQYLALVEKFKNK